MGFIRARLPKILALLLLLLIPELSVVVNHFLRATLDPDIWWHIRVGDWILQHHAFPQTGIFSQYEQGHAWIAYSWGFEVLMAWAFRIAGLASIPLMLIILRSTVLIAVFVMVVRISNRFWLSWLLTAAVAFPLTSIMVIRPVIFTLLFFAIELLLIFEARKQNSAKSLYWLPPIFLVWANTHIQFVYGLGLFGLFVICELWARVAGERWRSWITARPVDIPALRLVGLLAVSFLATMIGPYWGEVYLVILRYARNVSQYNEISELVALSFRQSSDYVVVILLMAACFALGRKRVDLFSGSLLFFSAMVSFRSNRDQWFVSLVACTVIAEVLGQELEPAQRLLLQGLQYAPAYALALLLGFGYAFEVGLTPQNLIGGIDLFYPVRATEFVRDQHLQGPMYNSFDWGGFLIFNLRDYPVSIDGRNDFYGMALFDRMQKTTSGIDWKSDPALSKSGFVLIQKTSGLAPALANSPDWKLAYSDHIAVIFVKRETQQN